jgi:hypothetical protein
VASHGHTSTGQELASALQQAVADCIMMAAQPALSRSVQNSTHTAQQQQQLPGDSATAEAPPQQQPPAAAGPSPAPARCCGATISMTATTHHQSNAKTTTQTQHNSAQLANPLVAAFTTYQQRHPMSQFDNTWMHGMHASQCASGCSSHMRSACAGHRGSPYTLCIQPCAQQRQPTDRMAATCIGCSVCVQLCHNIPQH